MSTYNTTLQSNNIDLQSILNTINELPDAGSGGAAVETCTVVQFQLYYLCRRLDISK